MAETRFKNKGEECFGCSLANYFDLIGENSLAEKVYSDYPKHPFIFPLGGVSGLLTTKLVSDLTLGKYRGRLFSREAYLFRSSTEEHIKERLGDYGSAAVEAIKEEKKSGRITYGVEEFLWEEKALLLSYGHILLYCGRGKIIDDGKINTIRWWNNKKFYSSITGVLQVYLAPLDFTDLNVLLERVLHALGDNNILPQTRNV